MISSKSKINKILEVSKQVLQDVALSNGAIVAGNTDHNYYPHTAKDYRFVWPRDAAFVCMALDYIDNANERECEHEITRRKPHSFGKLRAGSNPPLEGEEPALNSNLTLEEEGTFSGIQERYFDWLTERPEDFKKEGLLWQHYSTNGRKQGHQFQPDQMGTSLLAIWHHFKGNLSGVYKYETLIRRLADGICSQWKGSYFFKNTADLWEEGKRKTSTKIENNFTYSLSACASGLEKALLMMPNNDNWGKTAKEMRKKIDEAYNEKDKYFYRSHGKIDDKNTDASLLGLVWPFEIIKADDERMKNTVKRIEDRLVVNGGVHRFEMDYYDGEGTGQEGAGAWPLLNFWMSIYWVLAGDKKKAKKYFDWVIEKMDDEFIPEQIYDDFRDGQGIKPLAWSHAMFIIAFYKL